MRHARYTLLLTFLIAAIAAQRVVGPFVGPFTAQRFVEPSPVRLTELARKIARRETKPGRAQLERVQLALRQVHTSVARLLSALVTPWAVTPFFFRLPPPVLG